MESPKDSPFLQQARKAVRVIDILQYIALALFIIVMLFIRIRFWVTFIPVLLASIVLFVIYSVAICFLDCPHCDKSLRYLWRVIDKITTCPFCGRRLN